MKELLEKEHPTHISPSNGRDKGRGFWPPFSSKRPPLPLGEHILAQVAKADKEKLPSNRALQRIARLVKGHPLAMLEASLAIGGGTYGVYTGVQYLNGINVNNPSPSSRSIDSFPNSFNDNRLVPRAEAETKKVNPKEVFDNTATKDTLKAGANATVATQEELAILFKNAIMLGEEGKPPKIRIPVPAKLKEGQSIDYSHSISTNENAFYLDDPNRKPSPTKTFSGMDFVIKEAGTEIPLLAEKVEIFQFPPVVDKGKSYFHTLILKITLPNGNPIFATIVSPEDIRNLAPEDIVKNAPVVARFFEKATPDMPSIAEAKDGIPLAVKNGKVPSILRTTKPNTHIRISFRDFTPDSYSAGNLPFETRSGNLPFNFIELEDNNETKAAIVP